MSLVVGVVCALVVGALALPTSFDGVVAWLSYINLLLVAWTAPH